ncbi:hypothetical protein ISN45_Aa05g013630 [Arabidopsis thaliana x Arabidopsis arenosa]|uniref:Uncharacterized protein n=1 Tax=Arabidopsis thaliana x Arabidopsis arenosa TaxID=1240361 RepID=A0A8T1ZNN6_9BRAS|nr:hypothetical protein ISN45_Aa05g013630 [Arabidopsis thaliana x Arabidopsis arenosa]
MKSSTPKLCSLKYSCEEVYERMENGLCIFCEEEDTPGHQQLKHKRSRIVIMEREDDLASDVKEEAHQILVTVTNPEPALETTKDSDLFIKPLVAERELGSVYDMLLVHKIDSHVKEEEELLQQSTSGNAKIDAHQVFDKIPLRVPSKEKQMKYLKAWKFKFKTRSKRRKSMNYQISLVEETALFYKDPKDISWYHVNKEFKETVAAHGRKIIDQFKLLDETSKPALYNGTIQISVWDSGGSPLECVDEKSSSDDKSSEVFAAEIVKIMYMPLMDDKCTFVDESSGNDVKILDAQQKFKTQVCSGFDLQALIELQIYDYGYMNQLLLLKQANSVWEHGGLLATHVYWKWLENCYKCDRVLKCYRMLGLLLSLLNTRRTKTSCWL